MKKIKELEAEIGKVVMNIENCDAAECNHKGWDALLDKLEAEKKTLKDVFGKIDERIAHFKKAMPKCTFDNNAERLRYAYIIQELEELKARING